jgi:2-polyprenyl-3-methyl-5-hydroxy-6-metoxy-1,4-benzoquinol methylase
MSWLRWLEFQIRYLGRPRWDTGTSPPELLEYIRSNPAGHAIDIGCGTGTNSITLARAGWRVTAVDFVGRAVETARRKARQAGVAIDFRVHDITSLILESERYDLALDIGCLHGVRDRKAYLDQLERFLKPGGRWLLYAFHKADPSKPGPGLVAADIQSMGSRFQLSYRMDGLDPRGRSSSWFLFLAPIVDAE